MRVENRPVGRAPRPRLGSGAGDPVRSPPLRRRSGRRRACHRADLPQPGLPRLGAAARGRRRSSTCRRRRRARTASTCCARASSPPTWSTTVSPTFARESLDAGVRRRRRRHPALRRGDRYLGIINGLDNELWNPATDADLPARYSATDLAGKDGVPAALCAELGLDPDGPVLAMVSRLDPQKGFDLVAGGGTGPASTRARGCACWARATSG